MLKPANPHPVIYLKQHPMPRDIIITEQILPDHTDVRLIVVTAVGKCWRYSDAYKKRVPVFWLATDDGRELIYELI